MDAQLLISGVIFGLSIGSIFFLMAIGLSWLAVMSRRGGMAALRPAAV